MDYVGSMNKLFTLLTNCRTTSHITPVNSLSTRAAYSIYGTRNQSLSTENHSLTGQGNGRKG